MEKIQKLYKKLFYLPRTLMGSANEEALNLINEEIPLTIHSWDSGVKCFDWEIPLEWKFEEATISDVNGNIIIRAENILEILNYSCPFNNGEVSNKELLKHIHTLENNPSAVPYRTSYYSENWGLCLKYQDVLKLKDPIYIVNIKTKFIPGKLLIGEAILNGETKREVILSSYICHPLQAHDGLSGVMNLIYLYNKLKNKKLKYTYRFFFGPETIGMLALLSQGKIDPKLIEYALVSTCCSFGNFTYKTTYLQNHTIDNIFIKNIGHSGCVIPFTPTGSDERQLSSPNIRIPTGSLMRTPYSEYENYHTSFDNSLLLDKIISTAELYKNAILEYELEKTLPKYKGIVKGGEPFLTKYDLYRSIGVPGNSKKSKLINWVLFLADGNNTIKDMARKATIKEQELLPIIEELKTKQLIKEIYE